MGKVMAKRKIYSWLSHRGYYASLAIAIIAAEKAIPSRESA
jgi:hypothetical protein